jgi:cytosine/adenosine deaminase-related metal-dependent hydrolase
VQLIHAIWITPEEIQSVAAAGSPVSLSPYTELRIGFPRTGELLAEGVTVGLSVDTKRGRAMPTWRRVRDATRD